MKIKILKENFPGEMPTGPSLGQPGGLKSPMPERQRKIMALIEVVGSKLDELQNYTGIYTHVSARWNNLILEPKYRVNQHGEHFRQYGIDGKELTHNMEETAIIAAKKFANNISDIQKFKKVFGKEISQSIEVAKILEEVNQYLVLIETLELDKDLALHVKKHIYKDRAIKFDYAGTYMPRLFNYGDYLAASGLAIKSLATVMPQQLGEPYVGQAIKDTAESFGENFKSLWVMMSEELIASGDHLEKRSDFIEVIEPEILKYMMKMGHPVSLFDLRNEGFYEEMMKKHPIAGGGELRNRGGAKVMLRKALRTLTDKGYIVQDDPNQNHRGIQTTFIINPQMTQQTGEEYFPKPEGIMENKMRLNINIINKLILEEIENLQEFRREPTKQEMKSVFEDSLKKAARDTAKYVGMDNNKDFIDLLIKTFKSDSFNKKIISNLKNNKVNESNNEIESSLLGIDSFLKSPEGEEWKKGIEGYNADAKERVDWDVKNFVDSKFNDAFEYEGLNQLASHMILSATGGAIGGAAITMIMMTLAVMMPEIVDGFGVTQGTFEKGAASAIIWIPLLLSGVIMPLMWAMHNAVTLKNNLELEQIKKTSQEVNQEIANLQIKALQHAKEVEFADKIIEAETKKAREANNKNSPYFKGIQNLRNKYQSNKESEKSNESSNIKDIKEEINKLFSGINHQSATTSNGKWRNFQRLFQNKDPKDMKPFYEFITNLLDTHVRTLEMEVGDTYPAAYEIPVSFETFLEGTRGSKLFDDMFYFVRTATKTTGNTKGKIEVNNEKLSALKKIKNKRKVIAIEHAKFASAEGSVSWAKNTDNIEYVNKGINSYDGIFEYFDKEIVKLNKMEEILKDPKLAGEKVGEIVGEFYSDYLKMIGDREARKRSKKLDQRLKPNEEEVEISDDGEFQDKKFDKKTMGKIAQQQGRRIQREGLNDKRKMKIRILKEAKNTITKGEAQLHFYDWLKNLPLEDKKKGRKKVAGIYKSTHTEYAKKIPWLPKWQNYKDQNLVPPPSGPGGQPPPTGSGGITVDDSGNIYGRGGKTIPRKKRKIKEATGEQKRQQRKDNWDSRDKQRRKIKAKIIRTQNKGEAPFKNERPDFDPIHDLGKAMKKQYKDLEVRANGEEIED